MKNYSCYSCKYWICFYVELFILVFLPYLALFILMWSNYSCLLDCCLSFPMIWATSYNLETLWCNLMSAEFERLENPTPQGCHNSHATFKSPFPDISYMQGAWGGMDSNKFGSSQWNDICLLCLFKSLSRCDVTHTTSNLLLTFNKACIFSADS